MASGDEVAAFLTEEREGSGVNDLSSIPLQTFIFHDIYCLLSDLEGQMASPHCSVNPSTMVSATALRCLKLGSPWHPQHTS